MQRIIDLHAHTTASDGSMSPRELVRQVKECGLSAVAITDHDTIEGIAEALDEGEKLNIEIIPGLEIGVDFETEMHILGYFFEENYLNMSEVLIKLKGYREQRNPKIINRLNELGFDIKMEEVIEEAGGEIIGRPHIAGVMARKGYSRSVSEAFEKYLSNGKPAYFKKDRLTPEEGIAAIAKAGGIPVLAHPMLLRMSLKQLDALLGRLAAAGLKGIEAYYVDHSLEETGDLLRLAIKHNLLVTGGSDFHGKFKPDIRLGKGRGNLNVPYELLIRIKELQK